MNSNCFYPSRLKATDEMTFASCYYDLYRLKPVGVTGVTKTNQGYVHENIKV